MTFRAPADQAGSSGTALTTPVGTDPGGPLRGCRLRRRPDRLTAFLHWVITERAMSSDRVVTVALATAGLPMALSAIFTFLGPAGLVLGLLLLALAAIATAEQVGALLTAEAGEAGRAAATPAEKAGRTMLPRSRPCPPRR